MVSSKRHRLQFATSDSSTILRTLIVSLSSQIHLVVRRLTFMPFKAATRRRGNIAHTTASILWLISIF